MNSENVKLLAGAIGVVTVWIACLYFALAFITDSFEVLTWHPLAKAAFVFFGAHGIITAVLFTISDWDH